MGEDEQSPARRVTHDWGVQQTQQYIPRELNNQGLPFQSFLPTNHNPVETRQKDLPKDTNTRKAFALGKVAAGLDLPRHGPNN